MYFGLMNFIWENNMDTYTEIIRILRELNQELADDNDAHDNSQETEVQTAATTKEKTND